MSRHQRTRGRVRGRVSLRRTQIAGLTAAAAGLGAIVTAPANAGQLPVGAFQAYNAANASAIQPGPFSLFTVPVDQLQPTQLNEGFTEVDKKATGFDILPPSQLQPNLLTDIEPVVIGPGGVLYLTDGHHTFTALEDSAYGSSNPTVYVNVIANYSNLTTSQFFAQMEAGDLLLPLNDGVPEIVNTATGSPIPTALTGLTSDPYRGLEYSILKNKNSKLFTNTSNITGAVGSSIPGIDKETGLYADFINADAYRYANGGLGLPYLSPGDIAIATQWNLNPNSATTLPNIGAVTAAQLPGFILNQNLTIGSTISNATLANGTLDGDGTFTGITSFNLGTASEPIIVGTPQSGFVMQLGNDSKHTVTLSGTNTYTGGTTITAGRLIIGSDAALGASPSETNAAFSSSLTFNAIGFPTNVLTAVEADNGIIFNSLTEGNGTLTIGTTPGGGTGTFSTSRPIAVDSEAATIDVNGYVVSLGGPLISAGTHDVALGNATGESDLTIDDLSSGNNGKLILSTPGPYFCGNIIIGNTGAPTVEVMSDAALGATNLPANELGQIELNSGTFQAGASFSSARSLFLASGSSYDTNGFTVSFGGTLTDVQRTLTVENSNAGSRGAVTFGNLSIGSTAILAVDAGTSTTGGAGTTVTLTNGISRNGNTDAGARANATLFIDPTSGSTLGSGAANGVEVFSSGPSTTLTNGIAPVWIITDSGGSASSSPYNFVTYNNATGYGIATYTGTFGASNVVKVSSTTTLAGSQAAYALNVQNGKNLTIGAGNTLTVGDGIDPAGLILEGTTTIAAGMLAFGASEAVIDVKSTNTISSAVTGSGGLTVSGSGTLVLSGATGGLSGPVVVNSGELELNTANYFPTSGSGTSIWLSNVKSKPSQAILGFNQSQTIAELNSDGSNSFIYIDSTGASGGSTSTNLTVGDSTNQTLSSSIIQAGDSGSSNTPTGTAVAGIITKVGSGVLDISGGSVALVSGSTIAVNDGALRIGSGVLSATATNPIVVAAGAELQYSGNGGSRFNDPVQGGGVFHLLGGTVQLTGTNTYSGGTVIETGATLDVTTANLPTNAAISNAGGILVFDQATTGTFSGVMSDGRQAGGPGNPNDMACTLVSCSGPTSSGTLIKDDSTGANSGNVTLANVQTYSGPTYVEAGTLTLGAVNTIASSSGVMLGRVGGGATAVLALGADNQLAGLADTPSNTTSVQLNGHTLTLAPLASTAWSFGGSIVDGSASGNFVQNGPGTSILTGTSTYTGTTTIDAGTLEVDGAITSSSSVVVNSGGTLTGTGTVDPFTVTIANGATLTPGTAGVPGTFITIAGNLALASGSTYQIYLNPTTSTYAKVTGSASLGGTVAASFASGGYVSKQYTILTAAGGLGGTTFGGVTTTNLPSGAADNLSYDANDVFLNLVPGFASFTGLNGNQQNVANALTNYFNSNGGIPAQFFGLSAGGLTQVDGEAATGAADGAFKLMDQFLNLMLDPFVDGRSGTGWPGGSGGPAMGFAPGQQASFPPDVALGYAGVLKAPPKPQSFDQRWSAWGGAFGGSNTTNGNAAAGSNTVTARDYGYAGGLDYHFSPDTVAGFALAGGGTNWGLAGGLGGGRSDTFQAGVYGATRSGPAYVAAALAFANHWISTNRIALGDQLDARFSGQSYAGRIEAGYRYAALPTIGVTPYAALQSQSFHTPNYSETDLTGGGFALGYNAMTATDTRSEVGARFDDTTIMNGMPLALRARLAWAHDWITNPALAAVFQSLPDASFIVTGATPPKNSALASAGAELHLTANWSATAKFDGEFASGSQTYAGTGTLRYTW